MPLSLLSCSFAVEFLAALAAILIAAPPASAQVVHPGKPLTSRGPARPLWQPRAGTGDRTSGPVDDSAETNRGPLIPFLETTDVFWTLQNPGPGDVAFPNRLEADIFPHLIVAQNFRDVIDIDDQRQRRRSGRVREFSYSISGTPGVRIRMLRQVSAPVRTPSYMPRANFQLLWARGLEQGLSGDAGAAAASGSSATATIGLWEAHVIVGHHSNGQDGCLSTEQRRDESGGCVPTPAALTAETINRIDGSFSTNYIRTGVNYSRNWLTGTEQLKAVRELRVRGEFELHPRAWVDQDIVDVYGRHRFNYHAAFAWRNVRGCPKRLEVSDTGTLNPGVVDTITPWSNAVQVSCFPALHGGWGFFARFYKGQDYYNAAFLNEIARLHVGLTFNQADFFGFRRVRR